MIYLIIVAASFGVYSVQQRPKTCNCTISQNAFMVEQGTIYLKEFTSTKCITHLHMFINVSPDSATIFDQSFTVTLMSSRKGKIHQQTAIGAPRVIIDENITLRKKENLWIEIKSKGKFSVSIVPIR
jgi:hypothetical protein